MVGSGMLVRWMGKWTTMRVFIPKSQDSQREMRLYVVATERTTGELLHIRTGLAVVACVGYFLIKKVHPRSTTSSTGRWHTSKASPDGSLWTGLSRPDQSGFSGRMNSSSDATLSVENLLKVFKQISRFIDSDSCSKILTELFKKSGKFGG
jgi:hypothetical protein